MLARDPRRACGQPLRDHSGHEGRTAGANFPERLADLRRRRHGHRGLEDRPRHLGPQGRRSRHPAPRRRRGVVRRCDHQQGPRRRHHVVECRRRADVRLFGGGGDRPIGADADSGRSSGRGRRRPDADSARRGGGPLRDGAAAPRRQHAHHFADRLADQGRSGPRGGRVEGGARHFAPRAVGSRCGPSQPHEGRVPRRALARAANAAPRDRRLRETDAHGRRWPGRS